MTTRNYGIDLLRLVLMFMICILHVLGQGGILSNSIIGTVNYKIFWFIEIFCYCAVNGFAFISGYTSTNRPHKYDKIVKMWFQAFFYSFILTAFFTIIGINKTWTITDAIACAFPVTNKKFWYFSAYFILYFAIPILNNFLFQIDEIVAKKYFLGFVILFSGIGMIKDAFALKQGYSALWLIVLYCLGVLAKRIKLFEQHTNCQLLFEQLTEVCCRKVIAKMLLNISSICYVIG